MKIQMKLTLMAAASALLACNTAQPVPECAVAHGGYAAKFTPNGGTNVAAPCIRVGDIIGVQKYRQSNGDINVVLKSEWQAENMYGALGNDPDMPLAVGKLSATKPDAENFCTVPTLSAAIVNPAVGDPNGDALTYTWSNVKLYMTGAVPGTQFHADLVISDSVSGCSANYKVDAAFPVVACLNGDGDVDPAICKLNTLTPPKNVQDDWYSGLTMNPTFDTVCQNVRNAGDPDLLGGNDGTTDLCVPTTEVPSLLE
jgi:hypothetical protein